MSKELTSTTGVRGRDLNHKLHLLWTSALPLSYLATQLHLTQCLNITTDLVCEKPVKKPPSKENISEYILEIYCYMN